MHLLSVWPVQTSKCSNPYYKPRICSIMFPVLFFRWRKKEIISFPFSAMVRWKQTCVLVCRNRHVSAFIRIPPTKSSSTIVLKTFWELSQGCWRQPELRGHVTIISRFSQLFSTLFEYKNTLFRLMNIIEFLGLIKAPGASFLIHHGVSLSSYSNQTLSLNIGVMSGWWPRAGHITAIISALTQKPSLYLYSVADDEDLWAAF